MRFPFKQYTMVIAYQNVRVQWPLTTVSAFYTLQLCSMLIFKISIKAVDVDCTLSSIQQLFQVLSKLLKSGLDTNLLFDLSTPAGCAGKFTRSPILTTVIVFNFQSSMTVFSRQQELKSIL